MIRDCLFLFLLFALMPWPASASAPGDEARVGRYAVAHLGVDAAQKDLLAVVVRVTFAPSITTVGQALDHLLLRSGYAMASLEASDPFLPILLTRPLPRVQRVLGPVKLKDALTALAGPAWVLVEDPVNRLISFELAPEYRRAAAGGDDDQ